MTQARPPAPDADVTKARIAPPAPDYSATLVKTARPQANQIGGETLASPAPADPGSTLIAPERNENAEKLESGEPALTNQAPALKPNFRFEPGVMIKERFLLKAQIGRGGMGIVFSAIDRRKTEALDPNPLVAIKILNADFASHPKALMALQREARKTQNLAHPNVATVFDFDREGDSVFMTMELLSGRPLDALIREVRGVGLERAVALPIIVGIAEGLAYSHKKGVVHSDLKPANIFLTDEQIPKILDFGIARAMPSLIDKHGAKDIFDAGSLGAYTEAYATTEMIEGTDPDPSDDVYALGLISYELLTGRHPYKSVSAAEAHRQDLKPDPIKSLPRREWKIIEHSLNFNRSQRPRDAAAFLKGLAGITKLQKISMAIAVVSVLTAVFLGYRGYQADGPTIPFAQLPAATQQEFIANMKEGDASWKFYEQDHNLLALQEAVEQYATAYQLHPRNRDAVKALQKAALTALAATEGNVDQQHEVAQMLAERSEYLAKFEPVRKVNN